MYVNFTTLAIEQCWHLMLRSKIPLNATVVNFSSFYVRKTQNPVYLPIPMATTMCDKYYDLIDLIFLKDTIDLCCLK